jgi:hypothetical protein
MSGKKLNLELLGNRPRLPPGRAGGDLRDHLACMVGLSVKIVYGWIAKGRPRWGLPKALHHDRAVDNFLIQRS